MSRDLLRKLPAVVLFALACAIPGEGARGVPRSDAGLAAVVVRGLASYTQRWQSELHTLRGVWLVDSASARPGGQGAAPVAQAMGLSQESYRLQAAVDGETWRESLRVISASGGDSKAGDESQHGFDGSITFSATRGGGATSWRSRRWPGNVGDTVWAQEIGVLTGLSLAQDGGLAAATVPGQTLSEGKIGGHACFVVTREERGTDPVRTVHKTWVCPDYGYAIVRVETLIERSPKSKWGHLLGRGRTDLSNFRKFGDGLWLPLTYLQKAEDRPPGKGWQTRSYRKARAAKLEVNARIAPEELRAPAD